MVACRVGRTVASAQPFSCTTKEPPAMDVTREITLPVEPDAAWDAVVDLERWLTEDGALALEPGAEGELVLRDGETRWATVADVRPGELLSFWWHAPDALATLVEVRLVGIDDGTRVVVVESGYA